MKMMIKVITIIFMFSNCTNGDTTIDKTKLLGSDYRLFKNTPAWELAKSVENIDTVSIVDIIKKHRGFIDYRDPVYGQTLLAMAVFNRDYASVKTLLELGADPNKQSTNDKKSALMVAAGLGGRGDIHPYADPKYLKILLKYGGNPNDIQGGDNMKKGNQKYGTPLEFACLSSNLEYVEILVDAGANVNLVGKDGFSPLFAAIVSNNPDIVMYLLNKGADYKRPMYTTIKGKKKYVLDAIAMWNFDVSSDKSRKENLIKNFLKANDK